MFVMWKIKRCANETVLVCMDRQTNVSKQTVAQQDKDHKKCLLCNPNFNSSDERRNDSLMIGQFR